MSKSMRTSFKKAVTWLPLVLCGTLLFISQAMAEEDANSIPSLQRIVRIEKNSEQQVTTVIVDNTAKAPAELLSLLPQKDPNVLTKIQIRDVAQKNRLFTVWEVNPGLRFQDGDISYWYEQKLPAWDLELQFLARRIVIERAEEAKGRIPSQGDLSALSQPVFSWLHELASKNWEQG